MDSGQVDAGQAEMMSSLRHVEPSCTMDVTVPAACRQGALGLIGKGGRADGLTR